MTTSYRILKPSYDMRIDFEGYAYAADELHEEIWLLNIELRGCYLNKRERKDSLKRIAQYEELLSALRSAGG